MMCIYIYIYIYIYDTILYVLPYTIAMGRSMERLEGAELLRRGAPYYYYYYYYYYS